LRGAARWTVSRVTDNVTVLWDDRASTDQWPFRAMEKIE
jgi:hypothetical protein